jgi:hypothetical protein
MLIGERGVAIPLLILSIKSPLGETALVHLDPDGNQCWSRLVAQNDIRSYEPVFRRHDFHDFLESLVLDQVKLPY